VIAASVPGNAEGTGTVNFTAGRHMQRPALLLQGDTVYLGFASFKDIVPYHGWVMAYRYDGAHLTQTGVFNSTPNGSEGGIWQSGGGLVADSDGFIYAETGNGTSGPSPDAGSNFGEAILKLTPTTLALLDYFIPYNNAALSGGDLDLSSAGPLLIPGTTLIAAGCKSGTMYVADTTNLGQLHPDADLVAQTFPVPAYRTDGSVSVPPPAGVYGGPVLWSGGGTGGATNFYVWGASAVLQGFKFAGGSFTSTPFAASPVYAATTSGGPQNTIAGILSLSASGTTPGSGIVWATAPPAPAGTCCVTGTFYAFDAGSLALLWSSAGNATRDGIGLLAKFVPPTVAHGKVYLATFSSELIVYGLLPD